MLNEENDPTKIGNVKPNFYTPIVYFNSDRFDGKEFQILSEMIHTFIIHTISPVFH